MTDPDDDPSARAPHAGSPRTPDPPTDDPMAPDGPGASPTVAERILAIPATWRRLVGVAGLVVALALLALGLGSFDTGTAPVSVPGSVLHGSLVRPTG